MIMRAATIYGRPPGSPTGSRAGALGRLRLWPMLAAVAFLGTVHCRPCEANDAFAGEAIYRTHCIGCHGEKGVPPLPSVPSFAHGDRLFLPDKLLLNSLRYGKNLCPAWRHIIPDRDLLNVLTYIRTLPN